MWVPGGAATTTSTRLGVKTVRSLPGTLTCNLSHNPVFVKHEMNQPMLRIGQYRFIQCLQDAKECKRVTGAHAVFNGLAHDVLAANLF